MKMLTCFQTSHVSQKLVSPPDGLHCSSPSKEEPLQDGGCSDLCWTQALRELRETALAGRSAWVKRKKTSSKAPFSIAMLVYQRIAVGFSKIIVFVCLILPLEFFWIRKITPAKCRDSGGKTWMFRYGTHCSCWAFVRYFVFSLWKQSVSIHASSLGCSW